MLVYVQRHFAKVLQIENPAAQAPLLEDLYEQMTGLLACIVAADQL